MTVKQLLSSLDSREITEWRAFFRIESDRIKEVQNGPPVEDKVKFNLKGYKR